MKRVVLALAVAAPLAAAAAGPLSVCGSPAAALKYASNSVVLNYDGGGALGPRSKAQADAIVTSAIAMWTNVSTSNLSMTRGANLPVDVTAANYTSYLNKHGDGVNPVIFDTDGSIIDAMLGTGSRGSILGFAGSAWYGAPTCRFAEGQAVINGSISISDARMTVTIAHELGHLVGLDHTQLDSTQGVSPSDYPLMYPVVYRGSATLHDDDVASVTMLYPDTNVAATYGALTGTLTNAGTPVRGANVWVRETTTNKVYSSVSDYLTQNNGAFRFLLPAGTYAAGIEAIASDFDGGSSVGPHSDAFPSSPSFQPPLYNGTTPMGAVSWSSGKTFTITAGCAATLPLTLQGAGNVSGNCAVAPPPPPPPPSPPPPPPPPATFVADNDVAYRNFSTGQLYRFTLNGAAITGAVSLYHNPDLAWSVIGRGDFDGDGVKDVLWRNAADGWVTAQFYNAAGAPTNVGLVHVETNPAWRVVFTPDLDGDGKDDILWRNSATGQVYAMLMNGGSVKMQGTVHTEGDLQWRIAAVGDFDGTGRENQLLWHHAVTGAVYLMDVSVSAFGFGRTGVTFYREPNTAWKIVAAPDLNGDGRADILWRNATTGQVYAMYMAGTLLLDGKVIYTEPNPAWQVVGTGDYDSNGRKDMLWRNEATGQLYVVLMNGSIIVGQGMVHTEPNLAWRVLGAHEFAK